ncbi:MAG: hypothetical protein KME31_09505 [Tolypothrix carrinoi HA7290-LM1]|jgi:hypothetical protein|nr:hypothetical protein [Tolypothrix carrinoi HA7290-LM1]
MKNQLSNSPMKFMIRLSTLALVAIAMVGCDEETQQQPDLSQQMPDQQITQPNRQPEPESSSAPSNPPIDPFYGSGPGGSFYGN